jgi:uncharacterized membrane protein YkoI
MTDDWQYARDDDELVAERSGNRARRIGWGVGLLAGGALVGAVISGTLTAQAESPTPTPSSSTSGTDADRAAGGHGGHSEQALTGTTAAKVRAAALAKVPGATVERVEKDADGAVYEAHLTKADGSHVTVKLDASFAVTAVETGGPGGPGRGHGDHGAGRPDETALTGATAAKVKAAALAKLPGATVLRVEKDGDGAVYEAHVTKADGSPATVKLDASFKVTSVEDGR